MTPQVGEHIELRKTGLTRWAWHVDYVHCAAQGGDGRMQLEKTKLARPKGAVLISRAACHAFVFVGRLETVGTEKGGDGLATTGVTSLGLRWSGAGYVLPANCRGLSLAGWISCGDST